MGKFSLWGHKAYSGPFPFLYNIADFTDDLSTWTES